MSNEARILIIEDVPTDAELNEHELRKAGIAFIAKRVQTKEAFLQELTDFRPDIILSDYSLPQFNGLEALRLLKEHDVDVPFILITGSLTEEVAVECMKEGAYDYILKTSLKRLPSAVMNALEKKEAEREKRRAVMALQRSEDLYRLLAENTGDLICMVDMEGSYVYISPSYQEVLGYSPEELLGRNAFSLVHPGDIEATKTRFREALTSKTKQIAEFRFRHRNGEWRIFESVGNMVFDWKGNPQRAVIISRDITERKRAEESLTTSEERYRSLVELSPEMIAVHCEGRFVYVNPAGVKLLGAVNSKELIGKPILDIVPLDDREKVLERVQQNQEGKQTPLVEQKIIRLDGQTVEVEVMGIPTIYQDKPAVQIIVRDITERKRVEEELRQSEEQLRQSQKLEAVGQLAGGVAHDFNNLLTVITGYSDLTLRRLNPDEPLHRHVIEIKKASERAASLTRQLLAFSRKQVLQPKVLELNAAVADMNKMLRRLIGEDIDLMTVLDPALGQVKADPGQIEQVLMNLVVNARDAMPGGGKLTIETANVCLDAKHVGGDVVMQSGQYVMLAVSDTGCGMDAEIQEHIFEPFFTTKEQGHGTGLGLSTVYGIVKQSGGNIWVYSEVGRGTTFKVYLPRVNEQVEETKPGTAHREAPAGWETILLVEDEQMVRNLAARALREQGYSVVEASNGEEALRIAGDHAGKEIHLLLTDMIMPRMNGQELAERLTRSHPHMRVLFMSGYTNRGIVQHGMLKEGALFLPKPFTLEGLTHRVREVLDMPKQGDVVKAKRLNADESLELQTRSH
jgi:PAS domain S-box-containing protein